MRLAAALLLLCCAAATADAKLVTRPVGSPALSDREAASRVERSSFEPRPENARWNHKTPGEGFLRMFHRKSDMPYHAQVTGNFTGTTDEILQWGAHKWGFSPRLFRAVATVETWWHQDFVGDSGTSYGLMQVRIPYHCCLPFIRTSTAFNVDYYGAILRAYYDGAQDWLDDVEHGRPYRAGDLWGSLGTWASGRWYLGTSQSYAEHVRSRVRDKVWLTADFDNG